MSEWKPVDVFLTGLFIGLPALMMLFALIDSVVASIAGAISRKRSR